MLGTWSALDVFLVSVAAAMLEIGNLTASIMGEACDNLKAMLGIECLRLEATVVNPGISIMAVAVITSFLVSRLILSSTSAHFRRVAMLHLWTLKKKYSLSSASGKEVENGDSHDKVMMGQITDELYKNTLSTKFANLIAGSLHESQFNFDGLSPEEMHNAGSQPELH